MNLPLVFINQIGLQRKAVQFLNQLSACFIVHADNVFGMVTQVQTFAARFRVCSDHRVIHRRGYLALLIGHGIFSVPAGARKIQVVHSSHIGNALFH